jgi:hypothetical protein
MSSRRSRQPGSRPSPSSCQLLRPLGQWLGINFGVFETVLLVLIGPARCGSRGACCGLWRDRRPREAAAETEWTPDRAAAIALLEEADRLAAEGRYGEAAHLLLQRSVHHIAAARPNG